MSRLEGGGVVEVPAALGLSLPSLGAVAVAALAGPLDLSQGVGQVLGLPAPDVRVPAGAAVANVQPDPAALLPWTGFGLFCLYTGVVLALAAWQLRRRDA